MSLFAYINLIAVKRINTAKFKEFKYIIYVFLQDVHLNKTRQHFFNILKGKIN